MEELKEKIWKKRSSRRRDGCDLTVTGNARQK